MPLIILESVTYVSEHVLPIYPVYTRRGAVSRLPYGQAGDGVWSGELGEMCVSGELALDKWRKGVYN